MISKSPQDIYKMASKNLADKGIDAPEELIKDINKFIFGDKVKPMLTSFEHLHVYVPKLGFFAFRKKKARDLYPQILLMIDRLIAVHKDPEVRDKALESYLERIEKLKKLLSRHDEYINYKWAFKRRIHELSDAKRDLEKQKQDMGGVKE